MTDLRNRFVFLSASYPARKYKDLADSQEIASAVKALVKTVFHAHGKIVFGGHPSISPLVLMMAREFGQCGRIEIYQSEVFDETISKATTRLQAEEYGKIIRIPIDVGERARLGANPNPADFPKSLTLMREAMLSQARTNPAAAVFIGGDTGLFEERTLFSVKVQGAPMYPVGAPGGAAREMAEAMRKDNPSELANKLATSRNYLSLMLELVADIEGHFPKARTASQ